MDAPGAENNAEKECNKMGLSLAVIEAEDEHTALHELSSMYIFIKAN